SGAAPARGARSHARASARGGAAGSRGRRAGGDRALVPAARESRDRAAPGPRERGGGPRLQRSGHPRPAHPLGLLLRARAHELQLAPAAGPRAGAGIRGLARGLPSGRARPLTALLGAARPPPAELARGEGLAERERRDARALTRRGRRGADGAVRAGAARPGPARSAAWRSAASRRAP